MIIHMYMYMYMNVCRDFPIRYEGPHVVSQKQVWVGVVSKGCDGVALNSSYINRLACELIWACGIYIVLEPNVTLVCMYVFDDSIFYRFSLAYQSSLGNTIGMCSIIVSSSEVRDYCVHCCIMQWTLLGPCLMVCWCSFPPIHWCIPAGTAGM